MTDEGPLTLSRRRYLDPGAARARGQLLCVGSKRACAQAFDDEATRVGWGEVPDDSSLAASIFVLPPARRRRADALAWLAQTRASFVSMPASLLPELGAQLPASLVTLQLTVDDGPTVPRWPAGLALPSLRGLRLLVRGDSEGWLEVDPAAVPDLEFLAADVDARGALIDALPGFARLRHLELYRVRHHDRVLRCAPTQLEVLDLAVGARKFDVAGIARLVDLRALRLNAVRGELDCAVLARLPQLEQLKLLNSKRLVHVEALLASPSLRRLEVLDCGRPFAHGLRARFEAHGFAALEIAYA